MQSRLDKEAHGDLAKKAAHGLQAADFTVKRRIIELLDVQVLVDIVDDEKVLLTQCCLNRSAYRV